MKKNPHSTIQEIRHFYQKSLDLIDIDILLAYTTKQSRESLLAHSDSTLTHAEYTKAIKYIERRINHEPIAYILGKKEFYGLDFIVNRHTLIPRPETELLVDEALHILTVKYEEKNLPPPLIIDIGTGSGNIIVTLAKLLLEKNIKTHLFALDISPDAIEIAKKNAQQHTVKENIHFIQSDLLENFSNLEIPNSTNDIFILANLPYLSEDIYQSTEPDVKNYEPITALISEETGLAHYHRLLEHIKSLLKQKEFSSATFTLIFEISPEQKSILEILIKTIFPEARSLFIQDYSQQIRFVKIIL